MISSEFHFLTMKTPFSCRKEIVSEGENTIHSKVVMTSSPIKTLRDMVYF
jgi:hypothetical protein